MVFHKSVKWQDFMKKLSEYYINQRISVKKIFTQHAIRSLLDKIS